MTTPTPNANRRPSPAPAVRPTGTPAAGPPTDALLQEIRALRFEMNMLADKLGSAWFMRRRKAYSTIAGAATVALIVFAVLAGTIALVLGGALSAG